MERDYSPIRKNVTEYFQLYLFRHFVSISYLVKRNFLFFLHFFNTSLWFFGKNFFCRPFLSSKLQMSSCDFARQSKKKLVKMPVVLIIAKKGTLITSVFLFLNYTAGDRNRTGTVLLRQDFKSCASASSATPAL